MTSDYFATTSWEIGYKSHKIRGSEEPPSYSGKLVVEKPIEIGRDLKGVKLESVYFSKNEALVIVWNRTPSRVKAHVAIALFDDKNRLIAAGAESSKPIGIRSGKQANYKFKFKNFVSSFKGVSRFHLAFVVVK